MNIHIDKEFSENFYCLNFSSPFGEAQVFFWFFENKVTIENFKIFEKRHGYGKELYQHILHFLDKIKIQHVFIVSRDSEEAYGFWSNVTQLNYSEKQHEHKIHVKDNLHYLRTDMCFPRANKK